MVLCDECKVNPAVIEMNVLVNGRQKHMHLCEECYAKMKNTINSSPFIQDGGGSQIEELFSSFNQPTFAAKENKD
ncbi:MAG: hypothetical protein ABF820_05270, partial [Sporolactobacillus sp.]